MKKLFALCSILAWLLSGTAAQAAGARPADMTASGAIVGSQLLWCPTGTTADLKCTFTQVDTFINAQFSGDFTVGSTGVATLKNTGPGATGPIGSTTVIPVVTIDAQGRVTALSSATAAGTVSSVSAGCGTSTGGSPITTTGTVAAALSLRTNTAASDPIVSTDCGNAVYENRATAVAVSIAQAGTAGFGANAFFLVCNVNAGVATITPTTSTIGGAATLAIPPGIPGAPVCYGFQSDGTNYNIVQTPIFNVAGTAVMGTSAISSASCASAVTVSAPGVLTTDTIQWGFNGDPTAITGFVPLVAGMLTIIAYPTANNINFKECNNTSSSVTPGAHTLNWKVVR